MTSEATELRNVLDRLIEANDSLEKLMKAKKLQNGEWQTFLSRSQAQLLLLHRTNCLRSPTFLAQAEK